MQSPETGSPVMVSDRPARAAEELTQMLTSEERALPPPYILMVLNDSIRLFG